MNIGILTYYFVHNYGAVLQAYGMQQVLRQLGHTPEFLTFNRSYDHMPIGMDKKYNIGLRSIPFLFRYLFANGVGTFFYNFLKKEYIGNFKYKKMNIGHRYSDITEGAVLIGSDEVFSIDVGVNPCLFGHDISSNIIFSYAASFGSTKLEDIDSFGCKELISSGIDRMKFIGVRDISSKNIVHTLTNRDATLTCDPVILYGFENEILRAREEKIREKYILLYSYDKNLNDKKEVRIIKKIAKENHLKIWSVGYYHKWCDRNIMCTPLEIFKYFCNAEFVITDTFHGSVLSIITNTPISVILKNKNQKVEFLLEHYQMSERIVSKIEDLEKNYVRDYKYNEVNKLITQDRQESYNFLKNCIAEKENA